MAIVCRFSIDQAVSVKKAVKRGLTQRLRDRVGMGDSDSSSSSSDSEDEGDTVSGKRSPILHRIPFSRKATKDSDFSDNTETVRGDGQRDDETDGAGAGSSSKRPRFSVHRGRVKKRAHDVEMGVIERGDEQHETERNAKVRMGNLMLPKASLGKWEQSMPADAVLTKQGADEVSFMGSLVPIYVALLTLLFSFYKLLTRPSCP
jgi:metal transporter CNNM